MVSISIVYASGLSSPAAKLEYVYGNGLPANSVRTAMEQPLQVRILDTHDNLVPDHPVNWYVIQGNGTFNNLTDNSTTTLTNSTGIAMAIFYPGPVAGVTNILKAQSFNGPELNGSPITSNIETKASGVSSVTSDVSATGPIPADGVSQSTITVTLTDDYMNKIEGKALSLLVSGSANYITPFTTLTNANGQAIASLASTKAEVKVVTIIDVSDGITLQDTAQVRFVPLAAHSISYFDGTNQTANYGTACKDPIRAKVVDINGNVIKDHTVLFDAYVGDGAIYVDDIISQEQAVKTDANGIASAHWILGTSAEVNRARAKATGLVNSPVEYIATANAGVATTLNSISGLGQTGTAGLQLPEPLVVQVVDDEGEAISNYPVKFKVDYGGGSFNRNSIQEVYTDVFGYAKGYLTLGRIAGSNIASVEAS